MATELNQLTVTKVLNEVLDEDKKLEGYDIVRSYVQKGNPTGPKWLGYHVATALVESHKEISLERDQLKAELNKCADKALESATKYSDMTDRYIAAVQMVRELRDTLKTFEQSERDRVFEEAGCPGGISGVQTKLDLQIERIDNWLKESRG